MYLFYRVSDKDLDGRKVLVLTGHGRVYTSSQWSNPSNVIERSILINEGGEASDYGYYFAASPPAGIDDGAVKEIVLSLDAEGEPNGIGEWHRKVEITEPMQFTVSNGNYGGQQLDLPPGERQINIKADPNYDTLFEINIVRNPSTDKIDIWYREDNGPIPNGYELVQTLLKGTIPAGTKDLKELNLGP